MAYLMHIGVKRRSGRYPWGSGENPYQHEAWYETLFSIRSQEELGMSEVEIANALGMSISELRSRKSNAVNREKAAMASYALRLKDKGYSNVAIGEKLGVPESTVRNMLKPAYLERAQMNLATANMLKEAAEKHTYLDIGVGVENHLGISSSRLAKAVQDLVDNEGYSVHNIQVDQVGTTNKTTVKVLVPPGVTVQDIYKNSDQITMPVQWSEDNGKTWNSLQKPQSVSSKRIMVRYSEDGGKDMDGVIQLRRGVEDLSLGDSRYSQVRIAVDGTHYLKGMAIYSDDMPDGVDIIFNTNKSRSVEKTDGPLGALKPIKAGSDPTNPFKSMIRQKTYLGKDGKEHLSALNIVNEQGDWGGWSRTLASQVLSKQNLSLAKKQLSLAYSIKEEEFKDIMALDNPAVRKKLLEGFASDCDAAAVDLKAAAMPRQSSRVILPLPHLKDTEIYAPGYKDGESVVLIRYPHGGKFEIPELTVNNKDPKAKNIMGRARDACGINPKIAERLSGADFDGDTVLVIPNNTGAIKTRPALSGLKDFDPKVSYPKYEGMKVMTKEQTQTEMGKVSNLITDMTIKGADYNEIARAVRHSMVVIDAEKHKLNYKQSYIDNGIAQLKAKYQGVNEKGGLKGASTLISRAKSKEMVVKRRPGKMEYIDPNTGKKKIAYGINPLTGEKIWEEDPKAHYIDKRTGKEKVAQVASTKMAENNPYSLSSGTPMEEVYADHASKLKQLANRARKEYINTPSTKYNPEARVKYAAERASLTAKLDAAVKNAPLERKAQLLANKVISLKRKDNPDMDSKELKKIKTQAIQGARDRVGAKKAAIKITDKEWEAIQNGAISNNFLTRILNNADLDIVKQLATPRTKTAMSPAKEARAKSMWAAGYDASDIAAMLGVSTTTIYDIVE